MREGGGGSGGKEEEEEEGISGNMPILLFILSHNLVSFTMLSPVRV